MAVRLGRLGSAIIVRRAATVTIGQLCCFLLKQTGSTCNRYTRCQLRYRTASPQPALLTNSQYLFYPSGLRQEEMLYGPSVLFLIPIQEASFMHL